MRVRVSLVHAPVFPGFLFERVVLSDELLARDGVDFHVGEFQLVYEVVFERLNDVLPSSFVTGTPFDDRFEALVARHHIVFVA